MRMFPFLWDVAVDAFRAFTFYCSWMGCCLFCSACQLVSILHLAATLSRYNFIFCFSQSNHLLIQLDHFYRRWCLMDLFPLYLGPLKMTPSFSLIYARQTSCQTRTAAPTVHSPNWEDAGWAYTANVLHAARSACRHGSRSVSASDDVFLM
ncbi:hypothetical protein BJ912DRAFT_469678 [Pholiota molesta]|nr:hypothetical protein BJ912DRAFT_469678 [Pholiota molesta]